VTSGLVERLAALASEPRERWRALLEDELDPETLQQALLWLTVEHATDAAPSLGAAGDARYTLVEELDRGATAAVWQAEDRVLERVVAIKLFDDASGADRAIREARVAGDIVSDHVVRILDVHDGERSFIVMELVAEFDEGGIRRLGRPASETRPSSLHEAIDWVRQAALGIHESHLRNVFHRDLNPRNVLITPISRRAQITDFGLAASRHGHCLWGGTPGYMAPEALAVAGDENARDRLVAIDIWGLGAFAYDLIAGRAPCARTIEWEAALEAPPALQRTANGEPVPAALRRVLARLLDPESLKRYRSARDVADELAAFLTSRPTSFDRGRMRRARLWSKRNPRVAATGLVALALTGMVAVASASLASLRDDHQLLVTELEARRGERTQLRREATRIRDELATTETELAARTTELAALERSLADQRQLYLDVLAAKETALQRASAERHLLLGQLEDLDDDRLVAESTRRLYERFWAASRGEAERATRERVRIQAERDVARTELAAITVKLEAVQRELAHVQSAAPHEADAVADHPLQTD